MATALGGTGRLIPPQGKGAVPNATIEDLTARINAIPTVGILLKDGKHAF